MGQRKKNAHLHYDQWVLRVATERDRWCVSYSGTIPRCVNPSTGLENDCVLYDDRMDPSATHVQIVRTGARGKENSPCIRS